MVRVTLPDGASREYEGPVSGLEVAESISRSLAKAAVAIRIDGTLRDLTTTIDTDAEVAIVTRDSAEGRDLLRHDAAHVMAEAVQELFPGTQVTIGPSIENGFYYDFAREEPFSTDDFEAIEKRMAAIVDRDEAIVREVWDRDEAIKFFKSIGEDYKAEIIESIPAGEQISLYRQGNFIDLCRGPHLPSTGRLGKAFKLMKLAGAYWRGDSRNPMLQRIYGTAWENDKALKAHLHMLEEAEKRDHRKLGREMDLFHFQEEGPGSVFWHPKGWTLFQELIAYMRQRQPAAGYQEVAAPELLDISLWQKSGHAEKFGANMFTTAPIEERVFALKPMNCPGHVQIFNQGQRSYRELPLRFCEFGKVHRFEPSGALHGLMRVRAFTQDDAHVFCTPEQITAESIAVCDLILSIYRDFGFDDVLIKFADRPELRIGEDAVWDQAEQALLDALKAADLPYELNPGEGAFYGPKLEFVLRDAIGRDWQCGTLQVDLNMPGVLGASYIGADGEKHVPVMLHRAMFGSLERFTGILIEHYAGRLPLWLAPVQATVATITEAADDYAGEVAALLRERGIRAELDLRNEKIGYKVREHSVAKVPVIVVLGGREAEERTVAVRRLGSKNTENLSLADLLTRLPEEAQRPGQRTVTDEAQAAE
ncbi:MAG: threonine--tRNA ligase [Alphaproteobacteria bacterium]